MLDAGCTKIVSSLASVSTRVGRWKIRNPKSLIPNSEFKIQKKAPFRREVSGGRGRGISRASARHSQYVASRSIHLLAQYCWNLVIVGLIDAIFRVRTARHQEPTGARGSALLELGLG